MALISLWSGCLILLLSGVGCLLGFTSYICLRADPFRQAHLPMCTLFGLKWVVCLWYMKSMALHFSDGYENVNLNFFGNRIPYTFGSWIAWDGTMVETPLTTNNSIDVRYIVCTIMRMTAQSMSAPLSRRIIKNIPQGPLQSIKWWCAPPSI